MGQSFSCSIGSFIPSRASKQPVKALSVLYPFHVTLCHRSTLKGCRLVMAFTQLHAVVPVSGYKGCSEVHVRQQYLCCNTGPFRLSSTKDG